MVNCYIRVLTPAGLQPVAYAAQSLADATRHEPADGIYTVTNTYNTYQTLKLDSHLDRLEDSARREGIPFYLDRRVLRDALRQMIDQAGFGSVRFRITVPREQPDHITITLEPFTPPSQEMYQKGVRCVTLPNSARQNAAAKTTSWMHMRQDIMAATPAGIYEVLLLDAMGHILEGATSNFYAIAGGALYTAGEGVLSGIARQIVFEVAPGILPVYRQPVHVDDIAGLDEAFITSSSRGMMPVIEIDGRMIGQGIPGPHTHTLRDAYDAWVQAHLEDL